MRASVRTSCLLRDLLILRYLATSTLGAFDNLIIDTMDGDEDWNAFLKDHPIFKNVKGKRAETAKGDASLELSLNSLPDFTADELDSDALTPSGRRQVMVIKDYELILAVGNQIRIAPLGDVKSSRSSVPEQKTYKVCMSAITSTWTILDELDRIV